MVALGAMVGCATETSSHDELPTSVLGQEVDVFHPGSDVIERFAPNTSEPEILQLQQQMDEGGVSCSSQDGRIDCFCTGGCWCTDSSCR